MTVAELTERLGVGELADWVAYSNEMGPLNLAFRIDYAIARSAAPFLGGTDTMRKLMPFPKEPEREATPEDLLRLLRGAQAR